MNDVSIKGRLLYQTPNHKEMAQKYLKISSLKAGKIIEIRFEMMDLGYRSFIRNEDQCLIVEES